MRNWINLVEGLRNPPEIRQFADKFASGHIDQDVFGMAANSHPDWTHVLTEYFSRYGFELLGTGLNGAVYGHPGYAYVVKVYRNDEGYEDWLSFCYENQHNPHVPKIKGKVKRLNQIFSVVRLERLVPVAYLKARKLMDEITFGGDYADDAVYEIAQFMSHYHGTNSNDMNASNIMARPDGTLVIIDPVQIDRETYDEEEDDA